MTLKKKYLLTGLSILAISLGACSGASDSAHKTTNSAPVAATQASAAVASGTFDGRSDHITTGKVSLVKTGSGYALNFAADFSLDGAPDPIVAVGNGETYDAANKIGALTHKTGTQSYALPASFSPANFSEVYVWCEKFNVPLGVAKLTRG